MIRKNKGKFFDVSRKGHSGPEDRVGSTGVQISKGEIAWLEIRFSPMQPCWAPQLGH